MFPANLVVLVYSRDKLLQYVYTYSREEGMKTGSFRGHSSDKKRTRPHPRIHICIHERSVYQHITRPLCTPGNSLSDDRPRQKWGAEPCDPGSRLGRWVWWGRCRRSFYTGVLHYRGRRRRLIWAGLSEETWPESVSDPTAWRPSVYGLPEGYWLGLMSDLVPWISS